MEKILLFTASLLVLTLTTNAQMTFAPVGTEYNYFIPDWSGAPFSYTSIRSELDTLIDGIQNRKMTIITRNSYSGEGEFSSMLIKQSHDSIFVDDVFMYNLAAKERDTTFYSTIKSRFFVLDSIRYMQIFSRSRKVYFFRQCETCGPTFCRQVTFVENYGPIDAYLPVEPTGACLGAHYFPQEFTCGVFEGEKFRKSDFCMPLAIENNEDQNIVEIYPNPARSILTVNLKREAQSIHIYNSLGFHVYKGATNSFQRSLNIDVSSFSPGMYYAEVKGAYPSMVRFVKQ
ncbi:MAG TPA: T9SS type A sorting domain-containing protein [Cytophagaceae bacterium]|jgi:hypothetical protein